MGIFFLAGLVGEEVSEIVITNIQEHGVIIFPISGYKILGAIERLEASSFCGRLVS